MDGNAESLEEMYNDAPPLIQQMFDWLAEDPRFLDAETIAEYIGE